MAQSTFVAFLSFSYIPVAGPMLGMWFVVEGGHCCSNHDRVTSYRSTNTADIPPTITTLKYIEEGYG